MKSELDQVGPTDFVILHPARSETASRNPKWLTNSRNPRLMLCSGFGLGFFMFNKSL